MFLKGKGFFFILPNDKRTWDTVTESVNKKNWNICVVREITTQSSSKMSAKVDASELETLNCFSSSSRHTHNPLTVVVV